MIEKNWYVLNLEPKFGAMYLEGDLDATASVLVYIKSTGPVGARATFARELPLHRKGYKVVGRVLPADLPPSRQALDRQAAREQDLAHVLPAANNPDSVEQDASEEAPVFSHVSTAVDEFGKTDDSKGPTDSAVHFLLSMASTEPCGSYPSLRSFSMYELDYVAGMVAGLRPESLGRDELETLFMFQAGIFREMRKRPRAHG